MARRASDARLQLGEPLASKLADFCAANYGAPQMNVIREALNEHIDARLAHEPALKARFEEARKRRLQKPDAKLHVIGPGK
jgi:hypothetical protein